MDGIPVKISEKYKPPKKIILPSSVLNRLSNETSVPMYDFQLERTMVDKIGEWRQLRKRNVEARRQRIETDEQTRKVTDSVNQVNLGPPDPPVSPPSKPYSFPESILKPVPFTTSSNSNVQNHSKDFNISDFEQDTSSPFDNMELKTLNDLEELAHVLQPNISCDSKAQCKMPYNKDCTPRVNGLTQYNTYSSSSNSSSSSSMWNQYGTYNHTANSGYSLYPNSQSWQHDPSLTFPHMPVRNPTIHSYIVQRLDYGKGIMSQESVGSKSVPDIVQELELELKDKRAAKTRRSTLEQPQRPASIGPTEALKQTKVSAGTELKRRPVSSLVNPFHTLGPACQRLASRLAEMGFPLPRAARGVQLFGDDETRVLEFLLQLQTLEEKNYPAERAEKALIVNKYNESETVLYLDTTQQLLDLGFHEDKIVQALARFGNDRDKVLDSLIS